MTIAQEFNDIATDIRDNESHPSNDYVGKKMFMNKSIVAFLLNNLVDEYKHCSLADICDNYLEQNAIRLNERRFEESRSSVSPHLMGAATETLSSYGKGIDYDVLLLLPVPGKPDSRIGVIINLEIQNEIRTQKGHLFKRMIFYTSNLITGQKGTIFSGDGYENICRVYSVWICPMAPPHASAIDVFCLNVNRICGEGVLQIPQDYYDLQRILFCQFNLYSKLPKLSIQRFLQLLLTACAPIEERLKELHDDYGIAITKECEDMCNLTYELYKHAKEEGERLGEERGEERGEKKGEERGKAIGKAIGKDELRQEIYRNMKAGHLKDNDIMKYLCITREQLNVLQLKDTP